MSRNFTLDNGYYEENETLFKKKRVTIQPGLTVLVGCNGIGKTTFLKQIQYRLTKKNIPSLFYSNLLEGGSESLSNALYKNNLDFLAAAMSSSEGERIVENLNNRAGQIRKFIETGSVESANPFTKLLSGLKEPKKPVAFERWFLFDAVDSGLSVDNIIDLKKIFFQSILKAPDKEIYIIVSANEYEMANGEQCFDVFNGNYLTFANYDEYRNFILTSAKWKIERYQNN